MPTFSLLSPLIFFPIQRLKARFRENGGSGSQMLRWLTKTGRVSLIRAPLSDQLRLALSSEETPYPRRTTELRTDLPAHRDDPEAGPSARRARPDRSHPRQRTLRLILTRQFYPKAPSQAPHVLGLT